MTKPQSIGKVQRELITAHYQRANEAKAEGKPVVYVTAMFPVEIVKAFEPIDVAKALAACQNDFNIAEHKEEWEKLEKVLVDLVQWIKTNAALLKLMEEWADGLKGK